MAELTKFIKELLINCGLKGLAEQTALILFFIFGSGAVILRGLWKAVKAMVKAHKQRILNKDLHPYFTPVEIKKATQYYIPTKCQDIAPSKELEPRYTHDLAAKEKLIPFFLKKGFKYNIETDDQRFYIILADSGMGKTTFMINLYLKYISQWFGKDYDLKLLPMGYPNIDEEINRIKSDQKKNMILLLDAFDEDSQAVVDYKKRVDDIIEKTHRFRKVIITCRTQFFPSEEEEPGETGILKFGGDKGFHIFRKMYISPFDDKNIKRYLNKKFSILQFKKKSRAHQIVKRSFDLMVRPMLLSYIDDLLESNLPYEYTPEIYEELINKWITRESMRYKQTRREHFRKELYRFSKVIAVDIYQNHKSRKGFIINSDEIEPFAKKYGIKLENLEMKSRSLLNRNARGEYKFSHISILDYFLALELRTNHEFRETFSFEGIDEVKSFYNDMSIFEKSKLLSQSNLKRIWITKKSVRNKMEKTSLKELEKREELNRSNKRLKDINAFRELEKLKKLELNENHLIDISPLKELKEINHLELADNLIVDINALRELRKINELNLNDNFISDISALEELKQLKKLCLNRNRLTDITALKEMKRLEILYLSGNQLTDITPLKELKKLKVIWLSGNHISNIDTLKELNELEELDLNSNQLTEISAIKELKRLKVLWLNGNRLKSVSILNVLNELKGLERLYLSDNQLEDVSILGELKGLKELDLRRNPLIEASELKGLSEYAEIDPALFKQIRNLKQALPKCKIEFETKITDIM